MGKGDSRVMNRKKGVFVCVGGMSGSTYERVALCIFLVVKISLLSIMSSISDIHFLFLCYYNS